MRREPMIVALAAALLASVLLACAGDDGPGEERADQVREAAREADLPEEVRDLLALLASSVDERFQVEYPNEAGDGRITISQDPPARRIDISVGAALVESRISTDRTTHICTADAADGDLRCERAPSGDGSDEGPFDAAALEDAIAEIVASAEGYDLEVEERLIVATDARCLVATRREDAPDDPDAGALGELCVSPEGAVLRVVTGGRVLEATGYTTDVPDGTFEVPDQGER